MCKHCRTQQHGRVTTTSYDGVSRMHVSGRDSHTVREWLAIIYDEILAIIKKCDFRGLITPNTTAFICRLLESSPFYALLHGSDSDPSPAACFCGNGYCVVLINIQFCGMTPLSSPLLPFPPLPSPPHPSPPPSLPLPRLTQPAVAARLRNESPEPVPQPPPPPANGKPPFPLPSAQPPLPINEPSWPATAVSTGMRFGRYRNPTSMRGTGRANGDVGEGAAVAVVRADWKPPSIFSPGGVS